MPLIPSRNNTYNTVGRKFSLYLEVFNRRILEGLSKHLMTLSICKWKQNNQEEHMRAVEVAQLAKAPAFKSEDLSSTPTIHMVKGEN